MKARSMKKMKVCWCENQILDEFSQDYFVCRSCQTLVSKFEDLQSLETVKDDENDFYGKNYWLEGSLEFPDIHIRSRNDLSERNLHWLKYLLQYQLPPAKILEIGCAHGSFVGLLQHMGFNAFGMEMSPWVIDYAKKTFDAVLYQGPIETANLADVKFDMMVMMDVVEHLSQPVETLKKCLQYLTDEGQFLIQLPCFPSHLNPQQILNKAHPFEQMMIPHEHLYLFSQESIQKLFQSLDFHYIEFLPAIFSHYDMFLIASRVPLKKNSVEEIEQCLQSNMTTRMIQAMLDLREREQNFANHYYALKTQMIPSPDNGLVHKLRAHVRKCKEKLF